MVAGNRAAVSNDKNAISCAVDVPARRSGSAVSRTSTHYKERRAQTSSIVPAREFG